MSIAEKLDKLKVIADELNAKTEALNAYIDEFEEATRKTGVSVSVWVQCTDFEIGWIRDCVGWRLYARAPLSDEWHPLRCSSRRWRVEAIQMLPALLDAMTERAKEMCSMMPK